MRKPDNVAKIHAYTHKGPFVFFFTWCKKCGNCVAFCPCNVLAADKLGYPFLAHPERCSACGLCEMLCPDFAISVSERAPKSINFPLAVQRQLSVNDKKSTSKINISTEHGPERVAPASEKKEQ